MSESDRVSQRERESPSEPEIAKVRVRESKSEPGKAWFWLTSTLLTAHHARQSEGDWLTKCDK